MWRSIFMAIGIMLFIVGAECLVIDSAMVYESMLRKLPNFISGTGMAVGGGLRQINTQEWMPWVFMAVGVIVVLYSIHIPRRFQMT